MSDARLRAAERTHVLDPSPGSEKQLKRERCRVGQCCAGHRPNTLPKTMRHMFVILSECGSPTAIASNYRSLAIREAERLFGGGWDLLRARGMRTLKVELLPVGRPR